LRNDHERNFIIEKLYKAADRLIEIEFDDAEDEDEDEVHDDKATSIFSRSSRGKKSSISKGKPSIL